MISNKKRNNLLPVVVLMICMLLGTQIIPTPIKASEYHSGSHSDTPLPQDHSDAQHSPIRPDPETEFVYLDYELATYAKDTRQTANNKWDGDTEIPVISDFLGEIQLINNEGDEVHYALFCQNGKMQEQEYSYIWWVQREGDQFSAAQDTDILWQVPGLSEYYSYYGTADLSEFCQLVLKDRFDHAYDVMINTVADLDLSEYTIQWAEHTDESFLYPSSILNKKLQAYAEQVRLETYSKWTQNKVAPGLCTCLGEIWLDYGYVQIQYILYEQEVILKEHSYKYIWWAQDTLHRGNLPYTREYSAAEDTELLWQVQESSDIFSLNGIGTIQEFQDQVLMTPIRNGYDVLYNSVQDLDLSEYSITHPEDADIYFVYNKPLYNKKLAAFAENMRMETFAKWDGTTEIPGTSVCLGEVQMKHRGDHIQYVLYDQTATLQDKEYHYLWWAKSTREYFIDEHCIRQYFDTKEADVLWQAPELSEYYSYYGAADLEEFKNKVLMKDMQYNYDVIYNSIDGLDLSAYTYPRPQDPTPSADTDCITAYAAVVRQLQNQYGKAYAGGSDSAPYMYGLVMAKLIDFDQDGTPELLCSYSPQDKVVHYNYNIYSYSSGQVNLLYSGTGYDGCTDVNPSITLLKGNGRTYIRISGGEWHWYYYTIQNHQFVLAADVYATSPYQFNGTSYGEDSAAYSKAFDQFFGYPSITTYRYEIPQYLDSDTPGVYVDPLLG